MEQYLGLWLMGVFTMFLLIACFERLTEIRDMVKHLFLEEFADDDESEEAR